MLGTTSSTERAVPNEDLLNDLHLGNSRAHLESKREMEVSKLRGLLKSEKLFINPDNWD